jgi:hypothetical protein
MNNHRYTLEKYNGMKTRYSCPSCNKINEFTRYIDTQTKEYLSNKVGSCNRRIECGYHYKPKQYFHDNNISFDKTKSIPFIRRTPKLKTKTSFINAKIMQESINSKKPNLFIDFLANIWDKEIANYLKIKYNIGTSNYWNGATTFWQQDIKGNVRSGKIILYNLANGKRIKKPYNHINWEHKTRKLENFNLEQCYFGEHLINKDKSKAIALCESEKTAIISSIYLPDFIWLACGGLNNLNEVKTRVLKGRNVVLFPDLKCFDLWNNKIPQLTKLATFKTSSLLEEKSTENEKKQGLDIADYLLKIRKSK